MVRMATFCRAELFLTMASFCCCSRKRDGKSDRKYRETDRKSGRRSHLLLHLGAAGQAVPAAVVYGDITS